MKNEQEKIAKYTTDDGYHYLTKRTLVRKAKSAGKAAAKKAMSVMGYVVTVKDGWVVKIYRDGRIEKLHQVKNV